MKTVIFAACIFFLLNGAFAQYLSPRQQYPGLFEAVQLNSVYPDNKTFVDVIPKQNPELIMRDYKAQKDKVGFDLKAFVHTHFNEPVSGSKNFKSDVNAGIREHIDTLWQVLYRPARYRF